MRTEEARCRFLLLAFLVGLILTGGLAERATAQLGALRRLIPKVRKIPTLPRIPKHVRPHYLPGRRLTKRPFSGDRPLVTPAPVIDWLNLGIHLSPYKPDLSSEMSRFLISQPTHHTAALTLQGYAGGVFSVIFSLDGKRIASGSMDGTAKIWDAETGQELLTLKGHSFAVSGVSSIPNGKRIVSGGHRSTVRLWDAVTGEETIMLKGHSFTFRGTLALAPPVYSARFNPSGREVVSGYWDGTLRIRDFRPVRETLTLYGDSGRVAHARFSPVNKWIVSGSCDGTVKVRDIKTGKETFTLKGDSVPVLSETFLQDGRWIVSGSIDGTVEVWFCRNSF
jgi:WD40 repeat protein